MAEMIILLRCNPTTGKKDIVIDLRSDADALPHEHEQQHRALVDRLLEGGALKSDEVGEIVVERVEEEKPPSSPVSNPGRQQKRAQGEGN